MQLSSDLWIILIASLVAISCSVVGSFLVLRRMAMLGDAISHAVLPGIAIAFLITRSLNSWPMLVGAGALGLATAFFVQVLTRSGNVRNDAAIGVTFTSFFALGVLLVSLISLNDPSVDLDLDCVLHGILEFTPLNTILINGRDWGPQAFWQMLAVCALCLATVGLFFKELKIASFDPEMATAVGINATLVHYGLMGLISVTAVGAFEPVGAILVLAMMVVPPATAYLLTDDLKTMIVLATICGVLSAILGYLVAVQIDASTSGVMTVFTGFFFVLAFLFSPRHGLVTKMLSQRAFSHSVAREDALQALWRHAEVPTGAFQPPMLSLDTTEVAAATRSEIGTARRALQELRRADLVESWNEGWTLTQSGNKAAQELVHRHRVYESYLGELGYPEDHVHDAADRAEHFISPQLEETIDTAAGHPLTDPHGKTIPHRQP